MPEPQNNPNSNFLVDPPGFLRHAMRLMFDSVVNQGKLEARRKKFESERKRKRKRHTVEYFHQLDDPYSHLASQVLEEFCNNYDIELIPHLICSTGGKNQPELDRLAQWARRDASLIAPYFGLDFPENAPLIPTYDSIKCGASRLNGLTNDKFVQFLPDISNEIWRVGSKSKDDCDCGEQYVNMLKIGRERLKKLGHYSGAMFYYGGEWYWGIDRLFYLERRLRDLGACIDNSRPYLAPRPQIDVTILEASHLTLDFYPSLNSPYTSIIYEKTLEFAKSSGIQFNHKPVLPMIMRGIPATREKGMYIMYDTKREADELGVPFGPVMTPIGKPVRQIYSLLPWAKTKGLETSLLSSALKLAFSQGIGLHRRSGLKMAVEMAGLSWSEAQDHLGSESWKVDVVEAQNELGDELNFWGVPSYRLRGGEGFDDLCVWGQDRFWLVVAEAHKRAKR